MQKLKTTIGKKIAIIIASIFALCTIGGAIMVHAAPIVSYQTTLLPLSNSQYDLGTSTNIWRNLYVNNITVSGTCTNCGGGGGSTFPFTPTSYGVSTSTLIGFLNGLFSTASSTFSGSFHLPALGAGLLSNDNNGNVYVTGSSTNLFTLTTTGSSGAATYIGNTLNIPQYGGGGGTGNVATSTAETAGQLSYWTSNSATPATLGKVATSSLGVSAPITFSGTIGAQVGGANGSFGCTTASAGVTGCLSGTDWSTFNNKGSGTVTAVSVATANGFAGSSGGGATPALTLTTTITGLLKGNGTAISAATAGTDYDTFAWPFTIAANGGVSTSTLMQFLGNASTTQLSANVGYFGRTATTTINGGATSTFNGAITISNSQATSTFDAGISALVANLTSTTATSTAGNGWNISNGCFAVAGVCLSSGSSLTGTLGQIPWFSGTNTAIGTSSIFLNSTNGFFGIGSTTPGYPLSIGQNPNLVIASSSTWSANATYTTPAGAVKLVVQVWGAGGGGGTGGSGGGAGSFVKSNIFSPSASYAIKVGNGGQGSQGGTGGTGGTGLQSGADGAGSGNGAGGGGGGSSSFGTIIACGGGGGAGGSTSGGTAGGTNGGGAGSTSGGTGDTGVGTGGNGGGGGCNTAGSGTTGGTGGSATTGTSGQGGLGKSSQGGGGGGGSAAGVSGNGNNGGTTSTNSGGVGGSGSAGASAGVAGTADESGGGGTGGTAFVGGNSGGKPGAGGGATGSGSGGALGGNGGNGQVTVYEYVYVGTPPFTIGTAGNVQLQAQTSGGLFIGTSTSIISSTFFENSVAAGFIASLTQEVINGIQYIVDIIDSVGHHMTGGQAPTCGTGCTTVVGDDNNMRVTTGSSVTSITVNFANTWKNTSGTSITPNCEANEESQGTVASQASSTPTTVVITTLSALTTKFISVHCEASNNFTF